MLERCMKFFRLETRGQLAVFLIIGFAIAIYLWPVMLLANLYRGKDIEWIVRAVLSGEAWKIFQYRMYFHAHIINFILESIPSSEQVPDRIAKIYTAYYGIGLTIMVFLLFRLCRRFASVKACTLACVYLMAIYPFLILFGYFHPSDPYGAILAVLAVELIADNRYDWRYFLILIISGFLWEKFAFLPLSVMLIQINAGRKRSEIISTLIISYVSLSIGQIVMRLICTEGVDTFGKWSIYENFTHLPLFLYGFTGFYGMQIYYAIRMGRKVPFMFTALILQLAVWPVINFFLTVLPEIRGLIVMIPLTWPLLAMFLDHNLKPSDVNI